MGFRGRNTLGPGCRPVLSTDASWAARGFPDPLWRGASSERNSLLCGAGSRDGFGDELLLGGSEAPVSCECYR